MKFSSSAQSMRSSAIRELMSTAARPDVISFAGGMPNNDLFPIDELDDIYAHLSLADKKAGFQYGPTPGYPPLLESLAVYLRGRGLPVDKNRLLITTGGMQAISLMGKILIDPGDPVLCEDPCFIGAISAFKSYQAIFHCLPLNANGIDPEALREGIKKNPAARLLYLTPYFHNPAGILYSEEVKKEVLQILAGSDLVLLEDDPYGELYFNEKDFKSTIPLKVLAPDSETICYTGSFSKIFGPGMRLGYLLVPEEIYRQCELAKQSADACTSTFTQVLADAYLRQGKLQPYLVRMRLAYARRARLMLTALERYMPPGVTWTTPRGGFYVWVKLPGGMDSTEVLKKTLAAGAVFVIGKTFDPLGQRNDCLRLSFCTTPEEQMDEGIQIVARSIEQVLSANPNS